MSTVNQDLLDELVRAGSLLSQAADFKGMASALVEQSLDLTRSDLACLYLRSEAEATTRPLRLIHRRGRYPVPERLEAGDAVVRFAEESREAVVQLERDGGPFAGLLLNQGMQSGIALPVDSGAGLLGVLYLNALEPRRFGRRELTFLESLVRLAGGMLNNARLNDDLRDTLRRVEALERYQESIFSSMTSLLITTDRDGRIRYFNEAADARLGLGADRVGRSIREVLGGALAPRILKAVERSRETQHELPAAEGILRCDRGEMDFSLTVTPLKGKRGANEGSILLFTDQTRERELLGRVERVTEERRTIKDMFARYLSAEVVAQLIEQPELVKPGGAKREATILFADIRGYTAFSENKDPAYVIEVLNEYFSEAVDVVVRNKGYIDKFIGDAIMAVWGVPLQSVEQDAVQAVDAALELQTLVCSRARRFFRDQASSLRVGIGMHSGPLVAGNLGSAQRMNYTVIGDTVNVAARLEGLAGPGEVMITEDTYSRLGGEFKVESRRPVRVKGKRRPLRIYRVAGRVA